MSITITTGGITMTGGGVSFSAAPPSTPTASWVAGGGNILSTVDRITYATDTATASVRGPLSWATNKQAATGNLTYGWWAGGFDGVAPTDFASTVQRITYATDTAASSIRGPINSEKTMLAAAGTTDYGWFAGGALYVQTEQSTVDRITYATDTATASLRGTISLARYYLGGTSDGSTYGWFGGGYAPYRSRVDRITYATDTATASVRGPLNISIIIPAATGNTTNGWWGGGYASGASTAVYRVTYATDTNTASVRGPLSQSVGTASGNLSYGWFMGAINVDRIDYSNDTATASLRGQLATNRSTYGASASGVQ